jgi:hypothetical protein
MAWPWSRWDRKRLNPGEGVHTDSKPQYLTYEGEDGTEYSTTIHALDHQILSLFDCSKCGKVDAIYNGVEIRCTKCKRMLRCERCVADETRACSRCAKITRPVLIAQKVGE